MEEVRARLRAEKQVRDRVDPEKIPSWLYYGHFRQPIPFWYDPTTQRIYRKDDYDPERFWTHTPIHDPAWFLPGRSVGAS